MEELDGQDCENQRFSPPGAHNGSQHPALEDVEGEKIFHQYLK